MTLLCDVNIIICWYKIQWRSRWTIFSDRNCPRRRLNFCVCVCGCLFTQRRTTRGEKVADAQRLPSAPRNTPESGRQGVCVNNNKPSPTHALTPEQTPFSSRNIFKRKKKREKSCWRFNRFANEDEHSWLGNMYTYSINGRLMPRQQLIMQIPPQVPYVNFPPFFFYLFQILAGPNPITKDVIQRFLTADWRHQTLYR